MKLKLKELSESDGIEILNFLKEIDGGENGFSLDLPSDKNFKEFLKDRRNEALGLHLKPNRVPQTIYWAYLKNKPIGVIKIRRSLSSGLLRQGGNIGYYIHKDYRKAGLGSDMLKLILDKLRSEGMDKVLITCYEGNIGSQRVIEKNGGFLEDKIEDTLRYWIKL